MLKNQVQAKFLLVFALLLFSSISISSRDIKVLAIGNSFSEDAVEQYLYELALEGGDNLIIGNAYRGGQSLSSHWDVVNGNRSDFEYRKIVNGVKTNSTGKTLLHCILDEDWDYITFQQVSQDSGIESTYEPYLTYLLNYVKQHAKNPEVKYALHRTWAYSEDSGHGGFSNYGKNQQQMFEAIVSATNGVYRKQDDISFIIPAGTAIQNGRTSFLGDIFCRDGYHLSYGLGRYTAACTWLEVLTGQNPIGKTYRPSSVSELEAEVAQYAAHYAVQNPDEITYMDNFGYDGENTIEPAPIQINFGSLNSPAGWNDLSTQNPHVFGLLDTEGNDSEIIVVIDDEFSGTNSEGVQQTTTDLNLPANVAATCLWGYNRGSFGGGSFQPTGGFLLSHLNKNLVYDFYIFASRKSVSDNRETEYVIQGENRKRDYLDAANNSDKLAVITGIKPTANGEIRLTATSGKNNTNTNAFYYINAMQVVAREYQEGDFDDDEKDPMIEIDENKKYYLRHIQTGLFLRYQTSNEGDFSLARVDRKNSDFFFSFNPIYKEKPIYNIAVNDSYINAGEDGECVSGSLTDVNGEIRLEADAKLESFKMMAQWKGRPNYLNFDNFKIGAQMFADKSDGAVWELQEVEEAAGMNGFDMSNFTVYPTISKSIVTITTPESTPIEIIDISGRILGSYRCDGELELQLNYKPGIYFVRMSNNKNNVQSRKIILID